MRHVCICWCMLVAERLSHYVSLWRNILHQWDVLLKDKQKRQIESKKRFECICVFLWRGYSVRPVSYCPQSALRSSLGETWSCFVYADDKKFGPDLSCVCYVDMDTPKLLEVYVNIHVQVPCITSG